MEKHGTPLWFKCLTILACALMVIYCVFIACIEQCHATPFVFVDTVNGDDASATPTQPNTPVRTYDRALQIIESDTSGLFGLKIKPGSAQPTLEQALRVFTGKSDIVRTHTKKEVIAGHGEVPDVDREESTDAGIAIVRTWRWVIMKAANGELFETPVAVDTTVEDY